MFIWNDKKEEMLATTKGIANLKKKQPLHSQQKSIRPLRYVGKISCKIFLSTVPSCDRVDR